MNTSKLIRLSTCLLALAIAGAVTAQQPDFPNERSKPASCDDFRWNNDMTNEHPRVVDACQETVLADGIVWARLEARFVRVQNDGMVVFSIRDKRDRIIEQVMMEPSPGQVAYINDRATEFRNLRASDTLNLYVPEGEYGYVTSPVAATPRFARVAVVAVEPAPVDQEPESAPAPSMVLADNQPLPDRLPRTAGTSHWLALIGGLLMLGGIGLGLRRQF